jgi:hypothetical protein
LPGCTLGRPELPRPLLHLIRFHDVLAPDASLRLGDWFQRSLERHRARRPIARIRLALVSMSDVRIWL